MFRRRREPVPFAFIAEADRFRSNVAPPPRRRPRAPEIAGRALTGITVVAGLAGALLLGVPALQVSQPGEPGHANNASHSSPAGHHR